VKTTTANTSGTGGQAYIWAPDYATAPDRGAGLSLGTNATGVYEHTASTLYPLSASTTPITGYNVLAVRYAGKTPSIFLNGALLDTATAASTATNVFASKQFGDVGSAGASSGFGLFQGGLNEAVIYNTALGLGAGGDFESVNNYLMAQAPEPGTMGVAAVVAAGALVRRRRRRR
jgi:MYXO-CTERM domain-containing protein